MLATRKCDVPTPPRTHFTNDLWIHNWKRFKGYFTFILIMMINLVHKFAHAPIAQSQLHFYKLFYWPIDHWWNVPHTTLYTVGNTENIFTRLLLWNRYITYYDMIYTCSGVECATWRITKGCHRMFMWCWLWHITTKRKIYVSSINDSTFHT